MRIRRKMREKTRCRKATRTIIIRDAESEDKNSWNVSALSAIITGLSLAYSLFTLFYSFYYKDKCETFYGIPGKYFFVDTNEKAIYLVCFILLILSVLMPLFFRNMYSRLDGENKDGLVPVVFATIEIGLLFGIVVGKYADEMFARLFSVLGINWTQSGLVMLIIILFDVFMVFEMTFGNRQGIKTRIKRAISAISKGILAVNLLIIILGIGVKLDAGVDKKTYYEFAHCDKGSYAVLSEYGGKLLAVPFKEDEMAVENVLTRTFELLATSNLKPGNGCNDEQSVIYISPTVAGFPLIVCA